LPGVGDADPGLAAKVQKFFVNRIRFFDPNEDPDNEDWPRYSLDSRKVMVLGHALLDDYNWNLEDDPMTADDRSKCDFWQTAPYYSGGKKDLGLVVQTDDHMEFK
jgi:hypothetical protein